MAGSRFGLSMYRYPGIFQVGHSGVTGTGNEGLNFVKYYP